MVMSLATFFGVTLLKIECIGPASRGGAAAQGSICRLLGLEFLGGLAW